MGGRQVIPVKITSLDEISYQTLGDLASYLAPFFLQKQAAGAGSGTVSLVASADGSVTVSGGGGPSVDLAVNMAHEELDTSAAGGVTVAGGAFAEFPFNRISGSTTLLDLTTPTNPLIVANGIYAITVGTILNPGPVPASGNPVRLTLGDPSTFAGTNPTFEGGAGSGPTQETFTWVGFLTAGMGLGVSVNNDDAAGSRTYLGFMSVVKLAAA